MAFHATEVQKKLEAAGFDARQALALASVLETDVVDHLDGTLVTRDHFDARLAQLKAELDSRFAELDSRFAKFDSRFAQIDSRFAQIELRFGHMDSRFAQIDSRFAQMDVRFADLKAEILKWMIGLIAGSTITMVLALLRFAR